MIRRDKKEQYKYTPSPGDVQEMISAINSSNKRNIKVTLSRVKIIADEVTFTDTESKINTWISNATIKLASRDFRIVDIRPYGSNATMITYEFTTNLEDIDEVGKIGGIRV